MILDNGQIVIMIICRSVKLLVNRPMINLEASDTTGWTALHFAVKNNFEEMVEVLAAAGADGDYKNMAGLSPLDIARKEGNLAIIKSYTTTAQGVGRLAKKEREREKEPEKKVGVLKEEGTSDAVFSHKKFNDNEIVALQMAALAEKQDKEKPAVLYTISPRKDKEKDVKSPGKEKDIKSPRKDKDIKSPRKDKDIKSPRKDKDIKSPRKDKDVKSPRKDKDTDAPEEEEAPKKVTVEVKGGWAHLNKM